MSFCTMAMVAANKAVAKWWCRDAKGNMSDSLVNFRGMNTATDADVIKDNASENARRAELGYELLNKSYFAVYEISSLKTMNQVYDEQDAAARKLAEKTKKPAFVGFFSFGGFTSRITSVMFCL